ncbi:hypothetical protein [Limosilactobacillus gastricus]|uniref:hypothetical protein n=1 Tax=Limosilactobacillus gastricus TaxID=227942 RepID=UPI0002E9D169|nr:hypothetical protein [Limosilactobacillus gastricus]
MSELITIASRSISDAVKAFNLLGLSQKELNRRNDYKNVGGFTYSDWEKVGHDMNRSLISLSKKDDISVSDHDVDKK